MHELGIVGDLINIIKEQAKENNFKKVFKLKLKVGENSGFDKEHLIFDFNLVSKDTIAENAKLEIENSPGNEIYLMSLEGEN